MKPQQYHNSTMDNLEQHFAAIGDENRITICKRILRQIRDEIAAEFDGRPYEKLALKDKLSQEQYISTLLIVKYAGHFLDAGKSSVALEAANQKGSN